MTVVAPFFAYARSRHQIYLDRMAGLPRPWTDDPVLQQYRFCNIFRELDTTTVWIRRHVREPAMSLPPDQQLLAVILARTFNRIQTLEPLFCQFQLVPPWDPPAWDYVRGLVGIDGVESFMRQFCLKPWVTGSYIVKTPDGMDKLAGALWIVEQARQRVAAPVAALGVGERPVSLQGLHAALMQYPYLGHFTAYEIVTDMRWMWEFTDVMTWANAGPGATRGLDLLHGRTRSVSQAQMCREMQDILAASQDPANWPAEWPAWEMRDVEHTLCELTKYQRGSSRNRFRI